jgi:two-component sensor histidine kinase/sensor domain CHASE-containing protein
MSHLKSLKSKVMLFLIGIFVLCGVAEYAIHRLIIYPSFLALERDEAQKDLERSVQALKREIHRLDTLAHVWSSRNDTYEFVKTPFEDYVRSRPILSSLLEKSVNLIYIFDIDGRVIWRKIYNLDAAEEMHSADFPKYELPKIHPLITHSTDAGSHLEVNLAGLFMSEPGPMLIASRPILVGYNKGPIRGAFVVGRLLRDFMAKDLVDQKHVDLQTIPIPTGAVPDTIKEITNRLTPESPYWVEVESDEYLRIFTTFPDIKGDAALLIGARISRKISAKGYTTIRFVLVATLASAAAALIVILFLLQRTILEPITNLTYHALSVGYSGDLSARVPMHRADEIGVLAMGFDEMVKKLRKIQEGLETRVRQRTADLTAVNEKLEQEILERKRAEEKIKASLNEKEMLLKEIHHRVKNNLQVVSSMLKIQSEYSQDVKTVDMFQESQNRVRSIALIHEMLYQSENLSKIDFSEYIQPITTHLMRAYGVDLTLIKLTTNVKDFFMDLDRAIPCGLIINELFSNVLKHAFPEGQKGEVHIDLSQDRNQEFTLLISDNGVGLPEGMDFKNTDSLGLQLVNALVDQLGGAIGLEGRVGTTFRITFHNREIRGDM